ncbi:MAG: ribosome small subunit-dependent GTPase A [Polyangiaceae bacterium]
MLLSKEALGWSELFESERRSSNVELSQVARVIAEHRGWYVVHDGEKERWAQPSASLRKSYTSRGGLRPAVGDWVVLTREAEPLVDSVFSRRSKLSRRAAGGEVQEQVVGANVDVVLVLSPIVPPVNIRRLERFLAMVRDGGARPAIALTKIDLCDDVAGDVEKVREIAGDAAIFPVCALTGEGVDALQSLLVAASTLALVGTSGAGKSTLINHWLGGDVLETREVRDDGKGRHTTTRREMRVLPNGALVIDTPGVRELALWDDGEGLEETFPDVDALTTQCRFTDCSHQAEPGCAVRAAIASGEVSEERVAAFMKLRLEQLHLSRERDASSRAKHKNELKKIAKSLKAHYKARR